MTAESTVYSTAKRVTDPGIAAANLQVLPRSTLLFAMYASLGTTAVLGVSATTNQAILGLTPNPGTDSTFLRYWLIALRPSLHAFSRSNTQDNLNAEVFGNLPFPEVPLPTQRKIAFFLDRETERIDALIDKKRRLIDLLEEKRTATITHAVTKGLDPAAPMKDSTIPWIGDIPAHWAIRKVAHVFRLGSGTTPKSDNASYYGGEVPWVLTGDLRDRAIRRTAKTITKDALSDYPVLRMYPAKSLVVAMYGATIGKLGWMTRASAVNQACCVLQPLGLLNPEFVFYWLLANRPHIVALGVGSGQPNISQEIISHLRIPAPGLEEQQEIVGKLKAGAATTDAAVSRLTTQLSLLAEYREALITAAVTGEIDVDTFDNDRHIEEATA